jgi:predicted Zn-dependent protease with MMP-like domain
MAYPDPDALAPDAALIEALAITAIDALPEAYRAAAKAVALRVEEFPTDEMVESLGIDDPFELTGMYDGVPLTERSVTDQPDRPDAIWLFRRPILDEWAERGNVTLAELVAHVLVHELAHHFGWSDDDIASVDPWWE